MGVRTEVVRSLLFGATEHEADPQYGGGNAIEPVTGFLLYGLVRRYQPQLIWETGTHYGYATTWMALAVEANGFGRIVTVDNHAWEPLVWAEFGLGFCVERVLSDSRQCVPQHPVDLLFLDAYHDMDYVREEWAVLTPHVRPGGLILVHDTAGSAAVGEVIDELVEGWPHVRLGNFRGFDLIQK